MRLSGNICNVKSSSPLFADAGVLFWRQGTGREIPKASLADQEKREKDAEVETRGKE